MLDAVRFEQRGVPAAAILTEPFADTGQAISELQGFDDYQFATVPHPIGSLTTDEAMAVADAVTPKVLGLLTKTGAQPARHRELVDTDAQSVGHRELVDSGALPTPSREPADSDSAGSRATGSAITDVIEELAAVLRADRADLTVSVEDHRITLRLHIPDEACAECVLPASMLVPMFEHRFDTALGPGWTITLEDPREVGPTEKSRSQRDGQEFTAS